MVIEAWYSANTGKWPAIHSIHRISDSPIETHCSYGNPVSLCKFATYKLGSGKVHVLPCLQCSTTCISYSGV